MVANFAEVTNSGLRGWGSSTAISCLMLPGRAEKTATRSARNVASPRLWVTNTMVLFARAVEGAERLVHQQNAGFKAQRAGERRALAHAAGELPGIVVGKIVETDGFEGAPRPRVTLGARYALEEHAEIDVLGDRIPGKQRVLLEHEGNVARHRASDRFSEHLDAPCRGPEETAHDVEQRGFSAAAGSDQADELAVHDIEGGVAQRTHVPDVCFLAEPMRDTENSDRDLVRRHAVARELITRREPCLPPMQILTQPGLTPRMARRGGGPCPLFTSGGLVLRIRMPLADQRPEVFCWPNASTLF